MESDDEIRRVPEMTAALTAPNRFKTSTVASRKRGRSPADKENKRLKRSNSVSFHVFHLSYHVSMLVQNYILFRSDRNGSH